MDSYKRILTIQDISCVGQCSLTVALPILSACGVETAILPSAVLSTHTGGFTGYTFRDLTDDIPAISGHWKKEGITFDAIYTGYLGSNRQIEYIKAIFAELLRTGGKKIVDPAMADHGKLYYGFDDAYVAAMLELCREADILLPNITEACFLTGYEYRESYDEAYVNGLIDALRSVGIKDIILTGVGYDDKYTGVLVCTGDTRRYYRHRRLPISSHGTGDVYASAFCGALLRGFDEYDSARIAADYTVRCIENTAGDREHWYGVKFETAIPDLIRALSEK